MKVIHLCFFMPNPIILFQPRKHGLTRKIT